MSTRVGDEVSHIGFIGNANVVILCGLRELCAKHSHFRLSITFLTNRPVQSRQVSPSSKMAGTIPETLSHYSARGYNPGAVVSTGTISGVAAFSDDPQAWYLKPGDVMECEIEKIGVLRNSVISWEEGHPTKEKGKK